MARLHVQTGKHVGGEHAHFREFPHSSGLHYVLVDELLAGFVFGHAPHPVGAVYMVHVVKLFFSIVIFPPVLCL